jgi:hypothetical protein
MRAVAVEPWCDVDHPRAGVERVQLHGHSGDDCPRFFDRVWPEDAASHGANQAFAAS